MTVYILIALVSYLYLVAGLEVAKRRRQYWKNYRGGIGCHGSNLTFGWVSAFFLFGLFLWPIILLFFPPYEYFYKAKNYIISR